MLGKEYLYTAVALRRIARNMADRTTVDRLEMLALQYEQRAKKALAFFRPMVAMTFRALFGLMAVYAEGLAVLNSRSHSRAAAPRNRMHDR